MAERLRERQGGIAMTDAEHAVRPEFRLERLLYGNGPERSRLPYLPLGGTRPLSLCLLMYSFASIGWIACLLPAGGGGSGQLDPLGQLLAGLFGIMALRANYLLACRIEDLRRRILNFDVLPLLLQEESLLFTEPQYAVITRRAEYRRLELRSPRGRRQLVGRELAWLLGIARRPSPSILQLAGLCLLGGIACLLLIHGLATRFEVLSPQAATLCVLACSLLLVLQLVLALCMVLAGESVLRMHIRRLESLDGRRRGA